ncbi:MAG: DUF1446 domain-containing protein [Rhizobacter sp.]|nr:DUF1446 domain-containing protein [Rhizobacter sp.]
MAATRIRIGSGAGYSGDRIEPAVELVERGDIDYLVFECLAERTIALAQQVKSRDPEAGFDPLLDTRMRAVLGAARARGVRIVTNMGAANPHAAARRTASVARDLGLGALRVAAVCGDDVLDHVLASDYRFEETGASVRDYGERILSANAYLGAAPICAALRAGAQVVVTGRAADPALFLAPLIHEFGWSMADWNVLGQGMLVCHLLECAGQITGGYFAEPGLKDVPGLSRLGFPIGEVEADGSVVISKVPGSGGRVSLATCKEQLLYEIHDPARYIQPDVVADFSDVRMQQVGDDAVRITGGKGARSTGLLKVSVGYIDSYVGEGQISYAGSGAVARARLALDIVRERLELTGVRMREARFDLIGVDALHGFHRPSRSGEPYEVRLRVTGRADSMQEATRIGNEVETLYTNGPAGGGGVSKHAREVVAVQSVLIPADVVTPSVQTVEVPS